MRDVRDVISLLQTVRGSGEAIHNRTLFVWLLMFAVGFRVRFQVGIELIAGALRCAFPFGSYGGNCFFRRTLARCRDRDKILIANHDDSWHRLRGGQVGRNESCSKRSRPQNFSVQQICRAQIGSVLMLARDKRPRIHFRRGLSSDGPLIGRSHWIYIGNFASKRFSLRELRVSERCSRGGVCNFSVVR